MSKKEIKTFKCPHCEKVFEKEMYLSLNTEMDKDAVDIVRNINFFVEECPHCKEEVPIEYPLVFSSPEKGYIVHFLPTNYMVKSTIDQFNDLENKYGELFKHKRIVVDDYAKFVEKIEIFESGLNDMVIEVYKQELVSNLDRKTIEDVVFYPGNNYDDLKIYVVFNDNEKHTESYSVKEKLYNEIKKALEEANFLNRKDAYVVNESLIEDLTYSGENNRPMYVKNLELIEDKVHGRILSFADKERYEEALNIALPFAIEGYKEIQNDAGVTYERLGNYKEAKKWYEKCNSNLSLRNLLELYDNEYIEFDQEEYKRICAELMKRKSQEGYLRIYNHLKKYYFPKEHKRAFNFLFTGIINCKENDYLVYEMAKCYEKGIGCEVDYFKSHKCYSSLMKTKSSDVIYNYARQLYYGIGCRKEPEKAIELLEENAESNFEINSIELLLKLYSLKEYKNEEIIKKLKDIYDVVKNATK